MTQPRWIVACVILLCCAMSGSRATAEGPATRPVAAPAWQPGSMLDFRWSAADMGVKLDPIQRFTDPMHLSTVDLGAMKTNYPVQVEQKQALTDLDAVIVELEKQCKSGSGGGSANPNKPMGSSVLAGGPGGSGPLHDPKAGTHVWGQLPPKLRDQILQSQTDGFPPGYESVLANYYSRLAQGQMTPDAGAAPAPPATRPASP